MTDIEVAYALSTPFSAGVDTVRRFFIGYCGTTNWVNGFRRRCQQSDGQSVRIQPGYEYFSSV
jgi:hypothetical protein